MKYAHPFRVWRKTLGLSQRDAAEQMGVHWHALMEMELGRRRPFPSILKKYIDFCRGAIPVEAFIDFYADINGGPRAADMHPMTLWRLRNGLTVKEVCERTSLSPLALSKLEHGRTRPQRTTAETLSRLTDGELSPELIRNFWLWRRSGIPISKRKETPMKAARVDAQSAPAPNMEIVMFNEGEFAGRRGLRAHCSNTDCRRTRTIVTSHRKTPPPEFLHKKLRNEGWYIAAGGRKQICPKCQERKKERPVLTLNKTPQSEQEEERAITPADKRGIFQALNHHFDPARGLYRQGHSDNTIAEGLEVPVAWVIKIREEMFGKLNKDADLERVKRRLEHLDSYLTDLEEKALPVAQEILDRIDKAQATLKETKEMLGNEPPADADA